MNPIKKKLKHEDWLQEGYELKSKIFVVRGRNGNVTLVKQEEPGPNFNFMLEDSHSRISDQEDSKKLEFIETDSQEEPYKSEYSNSGNSKGGGSCSFVNPKTLCYNGVLKEFAQ
jgi:hypothetical protein